MEKRITKIDILNAIKTVAEQDPDAMFDEKVSAQAVIQYVDTTIGQLEAKSSKAKERAAKVKAEGDELRNTIEAALSDNEFKTAAQIIEELNIEDLTPGKVAARVGQLIRLGKAIKVDVKVGDKKAKAYALPGAEALIENENSDNE